jgi:hypothetical protein
MNGNTTIISRAADYAAKKGMIVLAAAGNDGTGSWHFISAPADADSIITVGAVNNSGTIAGFSSYGPSSDGQVKPTLAAVGEGAVIANPSNGLPGFGNGTSFACPNLAGITTCLWQAYPEINNMGIIDAMQQSATKFSTPDDRVGYGIPDMKKSYVILFRRLFGIQGSNVVNCKTNLQWNGKSDTGIIYTLERKLATDPDYIAINTQAGSAVNYIVRNFTYTDDLSALALGIIKYRIRVKVSTDTTFYADSVTVSYTQSCNVPFKDSIVISPNPVKDLLKVKVIRNNAVKVAIVVNTMAGQKIYTSINQQAPGVKTYTVPMKEMSRGTYLVSVFMDDKKEITKKILKL